MKEQEISALTDKLKRVTQEREKEKKNLQELSASFRRYKQEMDQTIQKLTAQREAGRQIRQPSQSGVDRLRSQA